MSTSATLWYWRVAILRCLIYGSYVAWGMFKAGVEGYASWSDLSSMQQSKLIGDIVFVAFGGVILAFIDNSVMSRINPPPTITSQTTVDTHAEIVSVTTPKNPVDSGIKPSDITDK